MTQNTTNTNSNDISQFSDLSSKQDNNTSATELIRQKLARIYDEEPDVKEEIIEANRIPAESKHQKFMKQLTTSGQDIAWIQTEWHKYYNSLNDDEKKEVWQEFYDSQAKIFNIKPEDIYTPPAKSFSHIRSSGNRKISKRLPKSVKIKPPKNETKKLKTKAEANRNLTAKHHIQSILFGLGMGLIVVFIFLFGFFNEIIIAPFIQPGRSTTSTPIILSTNGIAPTANPEVIIPKINVEIPTINSVNTTDENVIENNLQDGVVHYPTTSLPGQTGNSAYFGHSSNNIFNSGKYKFAFVLLHTLVVNDTFYLTYNSKVYVYKIISRNIVDPSDVSVLSPVPGQSSTATLITCDPPGTSLKRLVVVGQQISPDPSGNVIASTPNVNNTKAASLPGNGQTLWGRFIQSTLGKIILSTLAVAVVLFILRKYIIKFLV